MQAAERRWCTALYVTYVTTPMPPEYRIDEYICGREIRRVDDSVQQQQQSIFTFIFECLCAIVIRMCGVVR